MYGLGYGQAGTTTQAASGTSDTSGGTTAGVMNLLSSLVNAGAQVYSTVQEDARARDEYRLRRQQNALLASMPSVQQPPPVATPVAVYEPAMMASNGEKKGMPTWGWAAIGVGAVALLGGAFFLKN